MSTNFPQNEVALLTINDFDILNSFPEEVRYLVRGITDEQFMDIAPLAWEKIKSQIGDTFWEVFSDSIREATMEVLDLDFDDDYNLVKE